MKMAKIGAVVDGWIEGDGSAISAVQMAGLHSKDTIGVVPCTPFMSMMSNTSCPCLRGGDGV